MGRQGGVCAWERGRARDGAAGRWDGRDVQLYTQGADDPLMIDARRGIKEQRALVKQISCKLDLDFKEHTLELPVEKGEPIRVTIYVRSLIGVARWFARSVDSRHCIPHVQRDANGDTDAAYPA